MAQTSSIKGHHTRKPIENEDRIKWALARYRSFQKTLTPLGQLKSEFGRSEAVISRGIQEAFSKGLVKIVPASETAGIAPRRNSHLEMALSRQFPSIRTIIVIDVEPPPAIAETEKLTEYDSKIHEKLGMALANVIASSPMNLNNTRIALSSGRGVFHAVQEFKRHNQLKAEGVTLLSLTGNMFFQTGKTLFAPMDADRNAEEMLGCLPPDAMLKIIGAALAPPALKDSKKRTWLGEWEKNKPDYAIIGIGVLYEGNRFWDYASASADELKTHLEPISDFLRELVKACKAVIKNIPNYYPVADIANYIFFVEPPQGTTLPQGQKKSINNLVKKINSHLLNVNADQLGEIQNLMLIAGTHRKVLAIQEVLKRYKNLACLTIDSEAATALLKVESPS